MHVRPPMSFVLFSLCLLLLHLCCWVAEEHPLWPSAPHSGFLCCFLVTFLHRNRSWSPTLRATPLILSLVFRGLSEARMARTTGKRTACCHRVGVRLNGKCLAWSLAERSTWWMLDISLHAGVSRLIQPGSSWVTVPFRLSSPRSASSSWLQAP